MIAMMASLQLVTLGRRKPGGCSPKIFARFWKFYKEKPCEFDELCDIHDFHLRSNIQVQKENKLDEFLVSAVLNRLYSGGSRVSRVRKQA